MKAIQRAINAQANPTISRQQEKYMKHCVKCMGLKAPSIQAIFKTIWKSDIKSMSFSEQMSLSMECYASEYSEYKSIGCCILHKIYKQLDQEFLKNEAQQILRDHCNTWATCDSFSSKVIRHMIHNDKTNEYAMVVKQWKDSDCIWIQRSACVSFVCLARFGDHNDTIIEICSQCIKNKQRFVQLGTGWVLRELSLADLDLVTQFIKQNYNYFSREGLRYAIEKMEKEMKDNLLKYKVGNEQNTKKRKLNAITDSDGTSTRKKKRKIQ